MWCRSSQYRPSHAATRRIPTRRYSGRGIARDTRMPSLARPPSSHPLIGHEKSALISNKLLEVMRLCNPFYREHQGYQVRVRTLKSTTVFISVRSDSATNHWRPIIPAQLLVLLGKLEISLKPLRGGGKPAIAAPGSSRIGIELGHCGSGLCKGGAAQSPSGAARHPGS